VTAESVFYNGRITTLNRSQQRDPSGQRHGEFTRITQRVPVKIAIDASHLLYARMRPGMSVVVSVDTASKH